ncbi:MAG TPA: hypothetical protein VII72_05755, partial [Myxococcota bacterium]
MSDVDPGMQARPRELPRALVAACSVLVIVGIGSFVAGLATDAPTAWRAFHVNWLYTMGLSLGGLVLASAFVIIGARWCGPIRHVAEALAAWVPIGFLLAIVGIGGREAVFSNWIHGPPPGREGWLNPMRVYVTDLAILGVLALLTLAFLRASFRPALGGVAASAPRAKGLFARWTAGWRGDA